MPAVSPFRPDDMRTAAQRAAAVARHATGLRHLGARLSIFYVRAFWTALRHGDRWSLYVAQRPAELSETIAAARNRACVVEVGTGTAWTAIALALAAPDRQVTSYDIIIRPERELYLRLVGQDVRLRVRLLDRTRVGAEGGPAGPEMLFIDSSHEREETIATFREWEPRLVLGGVVAFHDYRNTACPGVAEAVKELELEGESGESIFRWTKGSRGRR